MTRSGKILLFASCLMLAACQNGAGPGTAETDRAAAYDGIGVNEKLNFAGNEPFWGGEVTGEQLIYTTPENISGQVLIVKRFAGMNGLGFSGTLDGAAFDMAVTPGECSDTMADRTYPFTVTLTIGDDARNGCGWTEDQPYTDENMP